MHFPLPAGITFTRDGRYMALAERRDCKDYVSIFVCSDWQLLRVRRPQTGMKLSWLTVEGLSEVDPFPDSRGCLVGYGARWWCINKGQVHCESLPAAPGCVFRRLGEKDTCPGVFKVKMPSHLSPFPRPV